MADRSARRSTWRPGAPRATAAGRGGRRFPADGGGAVPRQGPRAAAGDRARHAPERDDSEGKVL